MTAQSLRATSDGSKLSTGKSRRSDRQPKQAFTTHTRIHGKWYNLEAFMHSHPGGPVALSLAVGRDSTALFESYHSLSRAGPHQTALLEGMLVSDRATLEALECAFPDLADGAFDWAASPSVLKGVTTRPKGGAVEEDPFQRDVLSAARAYFSREAARRGVSLREATKATPARWLQVALMAAVSLACCAALMLGWWPAVVLAPLSVWILQANCWHDASHYAMSTDWRVNALLFYAFPWLVSPFDWNHQHIVGHHNYANIPGLDPDMYHAPHIWRIHPTSPWRPEHAAQGSVPGLALVWFFAVPVLSTLYSAMNMVQGHTNWSVRMRGVTAAQAAVNIVRASLMVLVVFGWPWLALRGDSGFWKTLAFSVVPWGVFSLCFMVSSQVNHHSDATTNFRSPQWYRHQCGTSRDIAPGSSLLFLFMGGLNFQAVHHLVPGVNHCHLAALQPAVAAAAAKHGVPYHVSPSLGHALQLLVEHLQELSVKPPASASRPSPDSFPSDARGLKA